MPRQYFENILFYLKKYKLYIISFFIIIILPSIIWIYICINIPKDFPKGKFDIHIAKASSINTVADILFEKHMISSKLFFKLSSLIISKNRGIYAGDYRFIESQNTVVIAYRMVKGEHNQPKIRITIPEGTNVYDTAFIYMKALPDFNAPRFISLAISHEGYLYPDTYNFFANTKSEEIIETMKNNFNEKIKTIESKIIKFNKPLKDIITMASLVEKEAYADESRKVISGILWKRIENGMPLQVDAPFYYITGKAGGFTLDDLKIKSPYNTYLNKGLPKGPISNPSIATIIDTIDSQKTPYLFYLTGNDGAMHYAENFDKHIENRNKYLR